MRKKVANADFIRLLPRQVAGQVRQPLAVVMCYPQKSLKILFSVGTPSYGQKIDDLNDEFGFALARCAHCFDQLLQSGNESIVPDAQEWAARDIANPGGFDNQGGRPSESEPAVPVEIVLSDESVFGGAPGDHRGYPGATRKQQRPNLDRLEQQRRGGFFGGGPMGIGNRMLDRVRKLPHCALTLARTYLECACCSAAGDGALDRSKHRTPNLCVIN